MRANSCVVCSHFAGLFSLINKVITCLDIYENVQVDFSCGTPAMYGVPEGLNLWDLLFEPTPAVGEPRDEIQDYPDMWLTAGNAAALYEHDGAWRQRLNRHWQRLTVRPEIQARVQSFLAQDLGGRQFVAVQVRANSHAGEQRGGRSQDLEAYSHALVAEIKSGEPIYVACDNEETLAWFHKRFPAVHWLPETRRSKDRDTDFHLAVPQTPQDAVNCLVEVLIFSRARALIHPVSNMATAALYINPGMKSIYLP